MRSRFVLGGLALVLSVLIAPVNADASVWISPPSHNDGICFRELFEHADQWEETRTLIDGVFYSSQDLDTYFTQEEYDSWFPMVTNWGLEFGLEVSSLKAGATNAAIVFNAEKILWDNFLSSGVAISEMTMDEPLWGIKELNAQGNAWATDAYAADEAAKFIKLVRANYPGILIGDTEPYPAVTKANILSYIAALQTRCTANGTPKPDFFRLEVNWADMSTQQNGTWQEVLEIDNYCSGQGIRFDLTYFAPYYNWLERRSMAGDETWYIGIFQQGNAYISVNGTPDNHIIHSLDSTPSTSVPETADWTFTRSVLDFCYRFISPLPPDDDWDDDGMLDTWERSQGIDPNDHTDGAADPDLDGMNNLGEYISMTDPANAASVFSVSSIDPALSGFGLSFYAATGRTYTVDYKDDLSDTNDWQVFLGNITTNVSGQMTIQDTNGVPRRYYRIKVELSP